MRKSLSKILIAVLVILGFSSPWVVNAIVYQVNAEMLDKQLGEVYYLKELNGSTALYKADAVLKNEQLLYSNSGKGLLESGITNDHISDFRYFPDTGELEFEAVYNGKWSILSLREGESEPTFVRTPSEVKVLADSRVVEIDTDYLSCKRDNIEVYENKGSLFLRENGQEKCIRRFRGMYSEKFTGYRPVGFSPDGKYLIYKYHGAFLGSLIRESKYFMMELATGKVTRYLDFRYNSIQWVQ